MIKALLVDDHPVVTYGIEMIISRAGDIMPSAHVRTGHDALNTLDTESFDVVILDIDLPDVSGIEVLKQIRQRHPKLPVLMLSVYDEKVYAVRAIRAGAAGYVTKNSAAEQLVEAIRKVCDGGRYITSTLAERLACAVTHGSKPPHESLSDREYEVMRLLALGNNVTRIAAELSIGHQTVSTYRRRILDKMALKTNTEIAHYAILHGLVDLG